MKKNGLIMLMVVASFHLLGQRSNNFSLDDKQVAKMTVELSLTNDQVAQLQNINNKFQKARVLLESDTAMSRENVVTEKSRILKERNAGIKDVLTKDQLSKWMEMMSRQSRDRAGARAASREDLEELKTALGLTNEQVKNITAINAHMTGEFRKLRSDTVSRAERSTEIRKIMDNRNAKIKKLLTEDQYIKFLDYEAKVKTSRRRGPRAADKK